MDLSKSGTTKSVLDRARRSAKQLAVTGTNHYANTARIAFVDKNDDILKGYRFLAVNDSKTSRVCARLDQQVFSKDSKKLSSVTPPLHPNCRSALTYEVDDRFKLDSKETDKASSFNVDGKREPKPVDSDSIYYANLKKLSARDQDAAIGPSLGKALRQMNPSEFAKQTGDSMNNALTIAQMKAKNNTLGRILRGQGETKAATKAVSKIKKPKITTSAKDDLATFNVPFGGHVSKVPKKATVGSISSINKANSIKKPKGSTKVISSSAKIENKRNASATLNKSISGDESAYLEYYKGDGFYKSNDILRNPNKYSQGEIDSAIKMRDSINSAIAKSTMDADAFVYRGVRDKGLFSEINLDSIGAELSIDTAQSVAKDARVALGYSGAIKSGNNYFSAGSESVIFKVKTRKGQHALDMESLQGIGNTSESELLLRSGGKYVITGVEDRFTPNGELSLKIIEVDYVD
jgi:SPP1 gp7 family putative phage head morphogenesis protein